MQVIRLHNGDTVDQATVISMGNFDGVHMGHRVLLEKLVNRAQQLRVASMVVTFEPHTREIVAGEVVPRLSTPQEKERLLADFGIDYLVEIAFTPSIVALTRDEFQQKILIDELNMVEFVQGEDHRFGVRAEKNSGEVPQQPSQNTILSTAIKLYGENGVVAGSREIREHLAKGEVEAAVTMLGHPYLIIAQRIRGVQIASKNGYPTLNFSATTFKTKIIPPAGVYAAEVRYGEQNLKGCLYYGDCPTYGNRTAHFEFFSLDLVTTDPEVGQECELWLHVHIRPDHAFSSTQALVTQISKDVETIKRYFVAGSN